MAEAQAQEFRLGRIGGLEVIVTPLAAVGTLLLVAFFFSVGRFVFNHGYAFCHASLSLPFHAPRQVRLLQLAYARIE